MDKLHHSSPPQLKTLIFQKYCLILMSQSIIYTDVKLGELCCKIPSKHYPNHTPTHGEAEQWVNQQQAGIAEVIQKAKTETGSNQKYAR